jgi:transposase-like protein
METRIVCPECKQKALPTIAPTSCAMAAACQSCHRVYERAQLLELQKPKDGPKPAGPMEVIVTTTKPKGAK